MSRRTRTSIAALLVALTFVAGSGVAASAKTPTTKKKVAARKTTKKTTKKATTTTTSPVEVEKPTTVRLGYFPNITHAPAIVGVESGIFAEALGKNTLKTFAFNAGPEASEALLAGAIDATYIGPNPTINAWSKSKAIKIVAGATSGGAYFVTNNKVISNSDLKGRTFATPQLGNTQDVALRSYLKDNGFKADTSGGGDVSIRPQSNATTLEQFKTGAIDGAWVPEPWATRLILEGKGHVFLDEAQTWPKGQFVTTHLVVSTKFLENHPDAVARLVTGHVDTLEFIAANTAKAKQLVDKGIRKLTGTNISDEETDAAWPRMSFTADPIASSLKGSAEHAIDVGLLDKSTNLNGIYDLRILNKVLKAKGLPAVDGF